MILLGIKGFSGLTPPKMALIWDATPMSPAVHFYMQRPENERHDAFLAVTSLTYPQLEAVRESFLHERELAYLNTLAFAKRRHSYLLGRYAAKAAAQAFMGGVEPRDIWIHRGVMNQPLVFSRHAAEESSGRLNPAVSISHGHDLAVAVAFSLVHPLAVDLEWIDARHERVILEHTTGEEKELLPALGLSGMDAATLVWTAKEALSKALLSGLAVPFKVLAIKSIDVQKDVYVSHFVNFTQYKALSVRQGNFWFSLVLPAKSELVQGMAPLSAALAAETPVAE